MIKSTLQEKIDAIWHIPSKSRGMRQYAREEDIASEVNKAIQELRNNIEDRRGFTDDDNFDNGYNLALNEILKLIGEPSGE